MVIGGSPKYKLWRHRRAKLKPIGLLPGRFGTCGTFNLAFAAGIRLNESSSDLSRVRSSQMVQLYYKYQMVCLCALQTTASYAAHYGLRYEYGYSIVRVVMYAQLSKYFFVASIMMTISFLSSE